MFWKVLLLTGVTMAAGGMLIWLIGSVFGEESIVGQIITMAISALTIVPIYWSVLCALYEKAKRGPQG